MFKDNEIERYGSNPRMLANEVLKRIFLNRHRTIHPFQDGNGRIGRY